MLLAGYDLSHAVTNRDRLSEIATAATRYTALEIVAAIRALERSLQALAAYTNPQLTLEVLLLELP